MLFVMLKVIHPVLWGGGETTTVSFGYFGKNISQGFKAY